MTYNISVQREGMGNNVTLEVNGEAIDGSIVPLPETGVTQVDVKVTLV